MAENIICNRSIDNDPCPGCHETRYRCKTRGHFNTFVLLHTTVKVIKSNNRCQEKRGIIHKFENTVAALRNTDGGYLVIHIEGQTDDDRSLEDFDQCFSKRVEDLIEDGQLYVHTCQRYFLSSLEAFKDIKDFVVVQVEKTKGIVTVDFNTKIRSDFENRSPACINVISLLVKPASDNKQRTSLKELTCGLQKSGNLHESRNVELKAIKPGIKEYEDVKTDVSGFVHYIWSNLKLKDNITSMSKVKNGGSYFLGISERRHKTGDYNTKTPNVEGFELHVDAGAFVNALKEKIRSHVSVLCRDAFQSLGDELTQIKLHPIQTSNGSKHVLEVAISYVDGVVFYDKEGPRTYIMENDFVRRMDKSVWLQRMKDINIRLPKQFNDVGTDAHPLT